MHLSESELQKFKQAIQINCDISDTLGSGIFSICGMALRLRDLNKWEKGLKPWEENAPGDLLDWIDKKEQLWEKFEGREFERLLLGDNSFDPFDTLALNRLLSDCGYFYGAGYAHSLKPTFFLAQIEEQYRIKHINIIVLGRELQRDLLTLPALNQDNIIVVRRDAARLFIWDQMAYLKNSGRRYLHFALKQCGLPDTGIEHRKKHFESILAVQEQTYIYHEVGEIKDKVFDHKIFRELVSLFPHSTVELIVRTIKDLLADTGPEGTLRHMITTENAAQLGFYAAFQDNLFIPLFPELRQAFEKFASRRDWEDIESARQIGFSRAKQYARTLMEIYTHAPDAPDTNDLKAISDRINRKLVDPLL